MSVSSLINGRLGQNIAIDNRGLAYGDGLFETIKVVNGHPVFLDQHLQRLLLGCQRLSIDCDQKLLLQELEQLLADNISSQSVLKIIVTRATSGRGYQPNTSVADRLLTLQVDSNDYSDQQRDGVKLRLCSTRLGINPALAGIKHLCRLENVLARAEWSDPNIIEGLMLDIDGCLVEGTMSNVFMVQSGKLFTPALDRCGVEGIVRQIILNNLSYRLEMDCTVGRLTLDDFYRADEVFICNSLIGIYPVKAMGCHQKTKHDVSHRLQQALVEEMNDRV